MARNLGRAHAGEFVRRCGKVTARVDLPAAGHDAHLDQPEAWIRVLREALA